VRLALYSLAAALVVFCVVQDRITARGAASYVSRQQSALAAGGPRVTIVEVMEPAIRRSVQQGLLWGGGVAAAGLAAAVAIRRERG
jgi:hypothetical protein